MKDFEDFVHKEADFLDQRRLNDWVELLHEDVVYWVPIDENVNPDLESSIIFDDKTRLAMRVDQIVNQNRISQVPPSETLRMISNLKMTQSEQVYRANYKMLLVESREGDWRQPGLQASRFYPARVSIEAITDGGQMKLLRKEIVLLGRHRPFDGLSFIL